MIKELLDLFFPPQCICCGAILPSSLDNLCLCCEADLPRTNYHLQSRNPIELNFVGRVYIERASAFLHFKSSNRTQKLLHAIKYRGKKELGVQLGKLCAHDLSQTNFFKGIDLMIPVPIHPKKLKVRRYNQASLIAIGISEVTAIPCVEDLLLKAVHTESQTTKDRAHRFDNVISTFQIPKPMVFEGKHILLIDDVITTGSTIEACATVIKKAVKCDVSVLSLAATD